ncbi:MAG: hypothetical protein QXW47_10855 [Candidatus Jordarchaeales archaeon]|nr:hypothetical protein [Candidatus Jordarchaeia archaeon]
MFKTRLGKVRAVLGRVRGNRLVRKAAESRIVKWVSQSRVVRRTVRVFRAARYPTREEMWLIVRISIVGILIVGGLAFLIKFVLVNGFLPMIGLSPS